MYFNFTRKTNEVIHLLNEDRKDDFEFINQDFSEEQNEKIKIGYSKLFEAQTPAEAHEAFSKISNSMPNT